MTDEELPERAEVASAYLDGVLESDERTRADADPETMALVESYRAMRTAVADVPEASMADRAAALSAALSEFDALEPMRRLTPLSELEPRRHHRNRWALSAAAAAVVLIAVIAVIASGGSNNSKKSASEPRSTTTVASASPTTKAAPVPQASSDAATGASATTAAAAEASTSGGAVDNGTPTPINSPAALRTYAEGTPAFTTKVAGASGPACVPAGDTVLGSITFLNIPAFAVLDGSNGTIKALAAADCRQLISVSP